MGGGTDRGQVRVYKNSICQNIYNATDMVNYCTLEAALAAASIGDVLELPAGT